LNSASLQYDAAGRRVKNAAGTSFLYDGANAAQELLGSTVTANLLSGGLDEIFTRSDSIGSFTQLKDALGSTIALVDASGSVPTAYAYDPFGGSTVSGAANSNAFQFTGRENEGNGLYFFRARYYSTTLGRFVSEDPLGLAGGDNSYRYANDSPLIYRDPWGLQSEDDVHAQAERCAQGTDISCVHSPEEIQQMRTDRERERQALADAYDRAHPPDLSGRYTDRHQLAPLRKTGGDHACAWAVGETTLGGVIIVADIALLWYAWPAIMELEGIEFAHTALHGGTAIGIAGVPGVLLYVDGIKNITADCYSE
jgi:RHS repeat-associated protein